MTRTATFALCAALLLPACAGADGLSAPPHGYDVAAGGAAAVTGDAASMVSASPGDDTARRDFAASPAAGLGTAAVGAIAPAAPQPTKTATSGGADDPKAVAAELPDHMLIFTGALQLLVDLDAFSSTIDNVVTIAEQKGGYVARQDNVSVQIRVPSRGFRGALREMEELGVVTNRSVQAQDVSEEFSDLETRLTSLRATRARLQKFLDRAKTIEEVLKVEQQLARIGGEIDAIEGRMRFLRARVAFSTIDVGLTERPKHVVAVATAPPPPPPPSTIPLPIDWLPRVGLGSLLTLNE